MTEYLGRANGLRIVRHPGDHWSVWLGGDDQAPNSLCIGIGATKREALEHARLSMSEATGYLSAQLMKDQQKADDARLPAVGTVFPWPVTTPETLSRRYLNSQQWRELSSQHGIIHRGDDLLTYDVLRDVFIHVVEVRSDDPRVNTWEPRPDGV